MPFQEETGSPLRLATRVTILSMAGLLAGCATAQPDLKQREEIDALRAQVAELHTMIGSSNQRLESLETRVKTLGDRADSAQSSLDNLLSNQKALPTAVAPHPSEGIGTRPSASRAATDPEAGFAADDAIQSYRKATILLNSQKYPESVLAFSSFLERYPDHPLAGSAQYYLGHAYFMQKEDKLALSEFERVLTSYDRSAHIADTLREMAEAEGRLKMTERAARHRQLLTSLFPQSPAAAEPEMATTPESAPAADAATSASVELDSPPTAPATPPTESESPAPQAHEEE